jgi:nicotinamidase-related amidase
MASGKPKKTALVVVDMINSYDHPDGEKLRESAKKAVPKMAALLKKAKDQDVEIIYVNDNFGAWNSSREELVEAVLDSDGKDLVEPIKPEKDNAFVVKLRHSIFFETPLSYLLAENDIKRVVLIGQATEQCILYSALDAYIRHFEVAVPRDAVAHIHEHLAEAALELMELNMDAEIDDADSIRLA